MSAPRNQPLQEDVRFKIDNIFRRYDKNMSEKLEEHEV